MSDIRLKITEPVTRVLKLGIRGVPGFGLNIVAATVTPVVNELIFTMSDGSTISAGNVDDKDEISTIEQVEDYLVVTLENGVVITSSTLSFGVSDHLLLSNLNSSTYSHVTSSIANIVSSLSTNGNTLLYNNSTIGVTSHVSLSSINGSSDSYHLSSTNYTNLTGTTTTLGNLIVTSTSTMGATSILGYRDLIQKYTVTITPVTVTIDYQAGNSVVIDFTGVTTATTVTLSIINTPSTLYMSAFTALYYTGATLPIISHVNNGSLVTVTTLSMTASKETWYTYFSDNCNSKWNVMLGFQK
jgi:hypothetical protein